MFGIGIALLVVLVETEWHAFAQLVPLLDAWLGRGILQVWGGSGYGVEEAWGAWGGGGAVWGPGPDARQRRARCVLAGV
jgi:hypothetical protein